VHRSTRTLLATGFCVAVTAAVGTVAANARTTPPARPGTATPSSTPSIIRVSPPAPPSPTVSVPASQEERDWMVCPDGQPVRNGHLDSVVFIGYETVGPPPGNELPGPKVTYGIFTVSGAVTPCHPVPSTGGPGFGIGAYDGHGGRIADGSYVRYSTVGATDTFHARIFVASTRRAICLVTDPNTRLGCLAIQLTGVLPVVGGSVPTNDPLVSRPSPLTDYHLDPGCPTCIGGQ
jgi:hypothetical protein